jgi:hypothetical protein
MSMTLNLLTATHSALGTSQALKSQHGSGYQLTVRLKPAAGIGGGIDPEAAFERVAAVLVYPRLTDHLVSSWRYWPTACTACTQSLRVHIGSANLAACRLHYPQVWKRNPAARRSSAIKCHQVTQVCLHFNNGQSRCCYLLTQAAAWMGA